MEVGLFFSRTVPLMLCLFLHIVITEAQASCRGRCGASLDNRRPCQCNTACTNFNDCCSDYGRVCSQGNEGRRISPISSADITRLARDTWRADTHRVPGWQYTINKQTRLTHLNRHRDRSPRRLFASLEPTSLLGPTIVPFRALLNNYVRSTGVAERTTAIEEQEVDAFLTAILTTDVMTMTYNFLFRKGYFNSQMEFRTYLKQTWFGLFSRSRGPLDSSAFEHTFVGEIKNGAVTGFHNWIQFFIQESAGNLNYYGYTREAQPHQLLVQFSWGGRVKTLSSVMVGVSPEFEMALYTVCFIAKPNQMCSFALNGHRTSIRTWTMEDKLAAAYFHVN